MSTKLVTVVGARPQFVKAATVSRVVRERDDVAETIIHTGQHFDKNMSELFFTELDIPHPDYNLEINSMSHGAMTGRMLEKLEDVFQKEKPDWVLVYGDTNSTLAGALAAKKLDFKLAHVEAGLRSFNMKMPEEINRILTDRISDILFCPTDTAVKNLESEGFSEFPNEIVRCGDVMKDAAHYYSSRSKKPQAELPKNFGLVTVHRAENTDCPKRLGAITEALNQINEKLPLVLPLHPRTRSYLEKYSLSPKFLCVDPVGYLEMIYMLQNCEMVMTDSGGLQKEAFFFDKPCITLRDETEWLELVDCGANVLCSPNSVESITECFDQRQNKLMPAQLDLYGDGMSADAIVDRLVQTS